MLGIRTTVSRFLEGGVMSGACGRALARAHAPIASRAVRRPLHLPGGGIAVITVGGATMGGSGKTRVAVACARELASLRDQQGAHVVLIGHGYRARPERPRVVAVTDALESVGDEALAAARALASDDRAARVRVVVGRSRQESVDFAASLEGVSAIVIDGPLQLAPERSSLAILAVDAHAPWGAGDVAPAGDLRAPREALIASADHLVSVDATPRAVSLGGETMELESLAASLARSGARAGLFTAIARPERLLRALRRSGIAPSVHVRAADHGPMTDRLSREIDGSEAEIWLATAKCALHLDRCNLRRPLAILDGSASLPPSIVAALAATVGALPTCMA